MTEALKILREKNHYSQATIASYLGVSRQMYIKYENGDVEPSVQIVKQLCKLYKVSYEVILDNKTSENVSYKYNKSSNFMIAEPTVAYSETSNNNYDLAISAISSLDIYEKIKLIGFLAEAINKGSNTIISKIDNSTKRYGDKLNNLSRREKSELLEKYSGSLRGIEAENPYDEKIEYLTKKYDL